MKRLKFKLQETGFKFYYLFYIGFFILYLAGQYYFLYHVNGLNPFSANIHFFSNVIGSLSKRFLSEASIYGLIFYLVYHSKSNWVRRSLVALFILIFSINTFTIGYYFIHHSNWQFADIALTPALVIFSVLIIAFSIVISHFVLKFRNSNDIWLFKKKLFITLLTLLALVMPLIPIDYSTHKSLVTTQEAVEKIFRVFYLEKSGTAHLYEIITGTSKPMIVPDVSVFDSLKISN